SLSAGWEEKANSIEKQLNDLTAQVSMTPTASPQNIDLQENMQALKNEMDQKINTFGENLKSLSAGWEEKANSIEKQLKDLTAQFHTLGTTIGQLSSSQTEQTTKMQDLSQSVSSQLANLGSRLQVFETSLFDLKGLEQKMGERLSQIELVIKGLNQSLTDTGVRLQEFKTTVDEKIGQVKGEMTTAQSQPLTDMQKLIQDIQVRVPKVEMLSDIQKNLGTLMDEVKTLKLQLDTLQQEKAALSAQVRDKGKDITQLTDDLKKLGAEGQISREALNGLKNKIEVLLTQKTDLEQRLTTSEGKISSFNEQVKQWEAKWDSEKTVIDSRITDVAALVSLVSEEFKTIKEDVQKGKQLESIQQVLPSLEASMKELTARMGMLEAFRQEITKKEIETRIASMEEKMSGVEQRIEAMIRDYGSTAPDIENLRKEMKDLKESKALIEGKVNSLFNIIEDQKIIQETEHSVKTLAEEKENLRQEIEKLGGEKVRLESEFQKKKEEAVQIEEEITNLKVEKKSAEEIRILEDEKSKVELEVQNMSASLQQKLSQIEVLQKQTEDLTVQLDETKKYTSYVILPWDNLWTISRRYYRDGTKWKILMEANSDVIPSPYALQPYTEIKIPRQLAQNQ
ncbi:MAG: LysM peptidoglycan-binding domain-containing protein, partial [Atribacterota bacterium]